MVELAKPLPVMTPGIPTLGCLSAPAAREEDRKKTADAAAAAAAKDLDPVKAKAAAAVAAAAAMKAAAMEEKQKEQMQQRPLTKTDERDEERTEGKTLGEAAGGEAEHQEDHHHHHHHLVVSPLAKSPESEHTDAHSVDNLHAEVVQAAKQTEADEDDQQAKRDSDTVSVVGKVSVDANGRLALGGSWHFQDSVLGDISYVMERHHDESGDAAQTDKSETTSVARLRVPENMECVWSGTFSMANPAYGERKKKRRSSQRFLNVPEKFLVTFVRRSARKESARHEEDGSEQQESDKQTEESDKQTEETASTEELSVQGFGRNRFGRFTLRGSLDLGTGSFHADKAYVPRDACGGGSSSSSSGVLGGSVNGERVSGRKVGRSDSMEMDRSLNGIRASKRQRVPNRMLMLDTTRRSYAMVSSRGSSGQLTPSTTCAIFDGGFFSPGLSADGKMFCADGSLTFPDEVYDAERVAAIRKRAQKATVALVRQLIQEQRMNVKQVRRLSSCASSTSAASGVSTSISSLDAGAAAGSRDAPPVPFYTAEKAAATPETFKTGVGQIYDGETDDIGRRHGYGICLLENGMTYEGMWCRGKMSGKGLLTNACGELVYQGEFADNTMSGRGTYLYESGDRYDGEFREGRFHGHGIYFHAISGGTFVGDWRRGQRHGTGDLYMPDGSGYSGDWSKDQWSGRGILNVKDICYYDGQFRDHKFDGRGDCAYANGAGSFEGAFRGGLKEGRGTYSFPNGAVYEGRFRGDGIEGFGTLKMTKNRAEKVGPSTWFLPVSCQSEMRYVHRAAGF